MKIGLRTADPFFLAAMEALCAEHGDILLPLDGSDGDPRSFLPDRVLTDLDSTDETPGEYAVTVSFDPGRSPTLLRPFTEDALFRALSAPPGERQAAPRDMVIFENGILYCCGKQIPLSPREKQVFSLLYHRRGQTVSPETIAREVWNDETALNDVHVYIRFLRKKLDEPLGRTCILTVRGEGFRLRLPGSGEGNG